MRISVLAGAALFALAGCGAAGGGGKAGLVKWCVEGGDAESDCTCMASRLEAELDRDLFNTVAAGFSEGEERASEVLENLPEEDQLKVMSALMQAGVSCTGAGQTP